MAEYGKVKMASTAVPKQEGVKLGTTSAFVQLGNKLVEDTDPKMSPRLKVTALFSFHCVYFFQNGSDILKTFSSHRHPILKTVVAGIVESHAEVFGDGTKRIVIGLNLFLR